MLAVGLALQLHSDSAGVDVKRGLNDSVIARVEYLAFAMKFITCYAFPSEDVSSRDEVGLSPRFFRHRAHLPRMIRGGTRVCLMHHVAAAAHAGGGKPRNAPKSTMISSRLIHIFCDA